MSKNRTQLAAEARAEAGKGAARAVRREGKIPAVIYGDNKEPALISLGEKELTKELRSRHFFTQLCEVEVGGQKHLVLPRDVQLNPVTDRPEHADFLRVSEKTTITVAVPLHVTNERAAPGIVKGGTVNIVHHELQVACPATDIPEGFTVDLTGLEIGSSVRIADLNLPKGVKSALDTNTTVITIVAPSAAKAEEAAPAAAAAAAPAKDAKKK